VLPQKSLRIRAFNESESQRLRDELQATQDASRLPELPGKETREALQELLVRVRLKGLGERQTS
jgi:hypothetical protein